MSKQKVRNRIAVRTVHALGGTHGSSLAVRRAPYRLLMARPYVSSCYFDIIAAMQSELIEQAKKLSFSDRILLVEEFWDTIVEENQTMSANNPISIPAHFDGERILLDEPVELQPNARLIVTVLPENDADRDAWLRLSANQLNAAYNGDVDDYPLDSIKEKNTHYEGR